MDESYFQPHVSAQHGTLFEHCACAPGRSLAVGSHDLPLIGTGDWNNGMNQVGQGGKGESVWRGTLRAERGTRRVRLLSSPARSSHDSNISARMSQKRRDASAIVVIVNT